MRISTSFLLLAIALSFLAPSLVRAQQDPCVQDFPFVEQNFRALYVNNFNQILGNDAAETELLEFAQAHQFNHLVLYKVKQLLRQHTVNSQPWIDLRIRLTNFIDRGHTHYQLTLSAIASNHAAAVDVENFMSWQNNNGYPAHVRPDAIQLEFEYWNSKLSYTFADYQAELLPIKSICATYGITCETYIGNPSTQLEVDFISANSDRTYVAYFKSTPYSPSPNIFKSKLHRLEFIANANPQMNMVLLFNSRQTSVGMYNWLSNADMTDPLYQPYFTYMGCNEGYAHNLLNNINNLEFSLNAVNVIGFSWYRYTELLDLEH